MSDPNKIVEQLAELLEIKKEMMVLSQQIYNAATSYDRLAARLAAVEKSAKESS
jgi:hypothetical protein